MAETTGPMTEDRKKEIFAALVATQDKGIGVAQSRTQVADKFGITRASRGHRARRHGPRMAAAGLMN